MAAKRNSTRASIPDSEALSRRPPSPDQPRVRYTRKSTMAEDRQAASHEQQDDVMSRLWGLSPEGLWFRDSHTGTTFNRPGFKELREYCRSHPQGMSNPGTIEVYDCSRLGRPLTESGEADLLAFLNVVQEFNSLGWRIRFTDVTLTGHILADTLTIATHAYTASQFSVKLRRDVTRGKRIHAQLGRWIHGRAPFPTRRFDGERGRILIDGESTRPGARGTVLTITPEDRELWEECARMYLGGASLDAIGTMLQARGTPTRKQGHWGHRQVMNMLTCLPLSGRIRYAHTTAEGRRETVVIVAEWPPLVDIDLFTAVEAEAARRASDPRNRARKQRQLYPLQPRCAHCGIAYHGSILPKKQGAPRTYVHPKPPRGNPAQAVRTRDAGCKQWVVLAGVLEGEIKDLIVRERASEEFADGLRTALLHRDDTRQRAHERARAASDRIAELKTEELRLIRLGGDASKRELSTDEILNEIKRVQTEAEHATEDLRKAKEITETAESTWMRVENSIHETRNLAAIWPNASIKERGVLLNHWVDELLICVEPVAGMRRKNQKSALAFLRSAPFIAREVLALDGAGQPTALTLGGAPGGKSAETRHAPSRDHDA